MVMGKKKMRKSTTKEFKGQLVEIGFGNTMDLETRY
jgi:hypothetical protein